MLWAKRTIPNGTVAKRCGSRIKRHTEATRMLSLLRLIGLVLGELAYFLGIRREVTVDNLSKAYPGKPSRFIGKTARRAFGNLGMVFAEMLYLRFAARSKVLRGLEIENAANVRALIDSPKGAILLSGHLGNWEWLALGCALRLGKPLSVIVKNQRSGIAENFLMRMRTRFGNKMVNAGDVRAIFRTIKAGELLAILGDQTATAESVRVPFFGRDVPTFEGTARLALQTGASILFLQPVRRTASGYVARFH